METWNEHGHILPGQEIQVYQKYGEFNKQQTPQPYKTTSQNSQTFSRLFLLNTLDSIIIMIT